MDPVAYYNIAKVFSMYFSFDIVLNVIALSAHLWNSDSKLEYVKFVALVRILTQNGIKPILGNNEEDLNVLPLK